MNRSILLTLALAISTVPLFALEQLTIQIIPTQNNTVVNNVKSEKKQTPFKTRARRNKILATALSLLAVTGIITEQLLGQNFITASKPVIQRLENANNCLFLCKTECAEVSNITSLMTDQDADSYVNDPRDCEGACKHQANRFPEQFKKWCTKFKATHIIKFYNQTS